MVECGSIDQPPSIENITIWGVVTFVVMFIVGLSSVYGVVEALNSVLTLWSFILLAGSGFGVAGLVFVIISLIKKNPFYMKLGIFCFLISCIINIVLIVFAILKVDDGNQLFISSILHIALDIFLCYLFYRQSSGFTPSV